MAPWFRKMNTLIFLAGFTSLISTEATVAQEVDKNIILEEATDEITFKRSKAVSGDVDVAYVESRSYACIEHRTNIPVIHSYDSIRTLVDIKIYTDGTRNKSIKPVYEYSENPDIFFHDYKDCFFTLPFEKKGSKAKVISEYRILSPLYCPPIYFAEANQIRNRTVVITIPDWMQVDIREFNFKVGNVDKSVVHKSAETIYTYTIHDLPPMVRENNMPGRSHCEPHLLLIPKHADIGDTKRSYFNSVADQYQWYRSITRTVGNDESAVRQKAEEIISGKVTDEEKVKAILLWVQQNVRYVAFENGIAGFRPDNAQNVLRKKYGDCKGMGNLQTVLLQSIGIDARLCWLGTNDIAYDYSVPSLYTDNHMIAAWMKAGKPVFLDGTEKFLGYGETAERIQGRQVLIANGDTYLLERVPIAAHTQNTSTEQRKLRVHGQDLLGSVTHVYKGEVKERVLALLDYLTLDKRTEVLTRYLSGSQANYQISNLKITDINDYNRDLVITYDVLHKNAFSKFGDDQYLDVDNRRYFCDKVIDTAKHHRPFVFPFKDHYVLDIRIEMPEGAVVKNFPARFAVSKPGYSCTGKWDRAGNELTYISESWIGKTTFSPSEFAALNADILSLKKFYNTQPELHF